MARSLRKGPFVDEHLLKKVEDAQNTGNKFLYSKSEKFGSNTIKTPINPKTIADHLLIPINSFKKNFAKIDTKKGQEKKSAFAVAKGI